MTRVILGPASGGHITMRMTPCDPKVRTRYQQLLAGWDAMPGLKGAALHRSLANDALVEVLQWKALPDSLARSDGCEEMTADHGIAAMNDPDQHAFCSIDLDNPLPALVAFMRCARGQQQALLDVLGQAADRFRSIHTAWRGAMLYPSSDGCGVAEYNQFENMAGVMAMQDVPAVEEHKARLATFGPLVVTLVMPIVVRGAV